MELIKDLCEEYDRRINLPNTDLPEMSYEFGVLNYAIDIDINGNVLNIEKMSDYDSVTESNIPFRVMKPHGEERTSGDKSAFLLDKSKYFFGQEAKKVKGKIVIDKIQSSFELSKKMYQEYMNTILENEKDDFAIAILNYFNNFNIDNVKQFEEFENIFKDDWITFRFNQELTIEHEPFMSFWKNLYTSENNTNSEEKSICCIDGKVSPIAKIHYGMNNLGSKRPKVVSTNCNVIESFGIDAKHTAEISVENAFKYATMLNHFINNGNNHVSVLQGGNKQTCVQKIVYWSENKSATDMFSLLMGNNHDDKEVSDTLKSFLLGKSTNLDGIEDSKLHILGVSYHSSRLVVDFYYVEKTNDFLDKIKQYNDDIALSYFNYSEKTEKMIEGISAKLMLQHCFVDCDVINKSTEYHYYVGKLLKSILNGTKYPTVLYDMVLDRIYHERENPNKNKKRITKPRVAFVKAFLKRNYNRSDIMSKLNENNKNVAYLLGRAFCVYESCVYWALNNRNKNANGENAKLDYSKVLNVIDSKYSAMMTHPKLSLDKINKSFKIYMKLNYMFSKNDYHLNEKFSEIMHEVSEQDVPKHMNKEQRGEFVLGYYQQKNFKSVDKNNK